MPAFEVTIELKPEELERATQVFEKHFKRKVDELAKYAKQKMSELDKATASPSDSLLSPCHLRSKP